MLVDENADYRVNRERRLQSLLDNMPSLAAYWNRDLINVVANAAYAEWCGLTPEMMRGRHMRELFGDEPYERNLPLLEKVLNGEPQEFQRSWTDAAGSERHTRSTLVPDAAGGDVAGFYLYVTDITENVESERSLAETQRLARLGAWLFYPDTRSIWWSEDMYGLVGTSPDTFVPTIESYLAIIHSDDRDRIAREYDALLRNTHDFELEYRLSCFDGVVRDVHSRGRVERDAKGNVTRIRGTVQDVTEARQAARELARLNEELVEANQFRGDMIAMFSHDARQPLTGIILHLDMLLEQWDEVDVEWKQERIRNTLDSALRLGQLLDDALAMISLDSDSLVCHQRTLDVGEVVRDAVKNAPSAISDTTIDLTGFPVAVADEFHVRQILANLLNNAAKYGQSPVNVVVRERSGVTEISVDDSGDGVEDEFVPRLFERFTRADSGLKSPTKGSGFGLYVARQLALMNGGNVLYSRNEPRGARFTLRLPRRHIRALEPV